MTNAATMSPASAARRALRSLLRLGLALLLLSERQPCGACANA